MKRKFWNWIRNDVGGEEERTLVLNGEISDETWYGDEVTPALFAKELNAGSGNITVWINSPGGDVYAAAQIYNMLMEYKGDDGRCGCRQRIHLHGHIAFVLHEHIVDLCSGEHIAAR